MSVRVKERASRLGPSKPDSRSKPLGTRIAALAAHHVPEVRLRFDLVAAPPSRAEKLLRKEVIQPQVPLRLPCYDFTPVTSHSLGAASPCGLGKPLLEQLTPMV